MSNPGEQRASIAEFFAESLEEYDGPEEPVADISIERAVALIRADRDGRTLTD